jgi:hypothetical protein
LNTEKRKQIVFEAIVNHPDNGKNQIWKIVQDKYGSTMSKPTFLKIVQLLNEEKKIGIVKVENNKSVLVANMAFLKAEKRALRTFVKAISQLRKNLDYYDKHKREFTDGQKTTLLTSAQRIIWITKWKTEWDISKLEQSLEFKKLLNKLEDLDADLFSYFIEHPDYARIWSMANEEYVKEYFERMQKIESILKNK